MKRIIIHWTAGTHKVSATDKKHYHFIVAGDGNVVEGNLPPEANESTDTNYAAHTRGLNTGSIGVSIAAMHNAKERPFSAGKYPITDAQVQSVTKLCARLSKIYGIPVQRDRVLTHAEVQPTLGVKQRGKWDITWLPGMSQAGEPIAVGDMLRQKVRDHMRNNPSTPKSTEAKPSGLAALFQAIMALFGGRK